MEFEKTEFDGLLIYKPKLFQDSRGYFMESFRVDWFDHRFIQDNQAVSVRGAIRGLHVQLPPYTQTKLVRVVHGRILDVVVDLRAHSSTYGKVFKIILSSESNLQLLIPKGFAHGYVALSDYATVLYKVDEPYSLEFDSGIHPFSRDLAIDWVVDSVFLSEKDQKLIDFNDFKSPF